VTLGEDLVIDPVVKHELPLGEDLVQPRPKAIELLAVLVVLGPNLIGEVA
jgi:hypothetical protein